MNERKDLMRRDLFENRIIDAEEVIARDAAGLPIEITPEIVLSPDEERAMKRYKKLNVVLGEGAFKKVFKAIDQEEGKEVAWNEVKITTNEYYNEEKTTFSKEITLLKRVSHKNILKIFDYWFTRENFIFITELMTGGTLREYISTIGDLNIKLIKKWGKQILEGLDYLHTQDPPIIHRDIKCENIFVNASLGEVKIGDLGIAKERRRKRYTVVGTPQFMAREMFEGEGYNEKVDMYAFGMCLIEMATGTYPYKECNGASDVYKCILQGIPPDALYEISDPCLKNLILNCLVLEKDRIPSNAALEHHFFNLESECKGECVPPESMNIRPLTTPANDMEISLISFIGQLITFQLFFMTEAKFIKFTFDIDIDTVEEVAGEMIREEVVDYAQKENLKIMLNKGVERAKERKALNELSNTNESNDGDQINNVNNDSVSNIALTADDSKNLFEPEETELLINDLSAVKLIEKQLHFPINTAPESTLFQVMANSSIIKEETEEPNGNNNVNNKPEVNNNSNVNNQPEPNSNINNKPEPTIKPDLNISAPELNNNKPESRISPEESPQSKTRFLEAIDFPVRKYEDSLSIEDFSFETAEITKRSPEAATTWIKVLKNHDITCLFDLKYLVEEDWDRLGLSVFICRAMKNMLYGIDKHPLKEKCLSDNPNLPVYEDGTPISDFLGEVALAFKKKECVSCWEGNLMSQDIRTVGELKSLHQDDWDRLGLSVFSYRAIKNMIFRKGKNL
jgi:WNK lysine deficient protein kinase